MFQPILPENKHIYDQSVSWATVPELFKYEYSNMQADAAHRGLFD